MHQRRIVFVIFDRFQSLDLTGPLEVFSCAGRVTGGYCCQIVAPCPGPVRAGSGLVVHAGYGVAGLDSSGIDTLVVTGGGGVDQARHDPALTRWIAAAGAGARRVTSVCTGVFLLAAAGLVAGHTVTTHWEYAERLSQQYPGLTVDCDPIFIQDGRVWTSAGVTAGMDLALALVEDDLGRDVAHEVAQNMVCSCAGRAASRSSACRCGRSSRGPTRSARCSRRSTPILVPGTASPTWPGTPG